MAKKPVRPRRPRAAAAAPAPSAEIALFRSGARLTDDVVERALVTGQHVAALEDYFGSLQYQELVGLAQEAAAQRTRGGARVYILPGIMGSKLGRPGKPFDDVLWLDLVDIACGRLTDLAVAGAGAGGIRALGVLLFAYLKLKLRLRQDGFDAVFHPFDWRLGIDGLGRELAQRVADDPAPRVHVVAHSMGGLVTRSALAQGAPKIGRVVMLGTPNRGSFAALQAIRGQYSVMRKIAALDARHDAASLAENVFNTLPGLYQLLPWPKAGGADLFRSDLWPAGPRPRQALLDQALAAQKLLAKVKGDLYLVAGVNRETLVGAAIEDGEFVYRSSTDGDGTVPRALAELAGVPTWYVDEEHGALPNSRLVAAAVTEILERGTTDALPATPPVARAAARRVPRKELDAAPFGGRQPTQLARAELRSVIAEFASPTANDEGAGARSQAPGASPGARLDGVVVARRRQHRLDIEIALGSITEVRTAACVLGTFADVDPGGAAVAVDRSMEGALSEVVARRMFSSNVGELFVLPARGHALRAEFVMLAGLGSFHRFGEEAQQVVAENVIRTLVRAGASDLATVLIGAGSGRGINSSLTSLLRGFVRGLLDADREHSFRRVVLCEHDETRYRALRDELYRLAGTDLFADVQVTLTERTLPAATAAAGTRAVAAPLGVGPAPVYLLVALEAEGRRAASGDVLVRSSLLTSGGKATVVTGTRRLAPRVLDALLAPLDEGSLTAAGLPKLGAAIARELLHPDVLAVLPAQKDSPLVVVHDPFGARVPWEVMHVDGWAPAAGAGLSRRYRAENLAIAKWLEERRYGSDLDLLLVVNPTGDLAGAEREGDRVRRLFGAGTARRVRLTELRGAAATRAAVLRAIRSGRFDALHYAGHAYFDAARPADSGIVCAGEEVLSGSDLANLGGLPALAFFNACESGRVRGRRGLHADRAARDRSIGLAEALLRGGIANFLGTYWPVGDEAALAFAETFYTSLLDGGSVGAALCLGRAAVKRLGSPDWADYIHYGAPDFALKVPAR